MNNNLSGGESAPMEQHPTDDLSRISKRVVGANLSARGDPAPAQPSRTPTKGGDADCNTTLTVVAGIADNEQPCRNEAAPTVQSAGRSTTFQTFLDSLETPPWKVKKLGLTYATRR